MASMASRSCFLAGFRCNGEFLGVLGVYDVNPMILSVLQLALSVSSGMGSTHYLLTFFVG